MTNDLETFAVGHWELVIGDSLLIGHWPLGIVWLLLIVPLKTHTQ
jgi:hypothetical protein